MATPPPVDELKTIVATAQSSGRPVVAHSTTAEGMRRAVLAGVETIEHGDAGTPEVFALMKEHNVALCPTLAAGDAISQYRGERGEKAPNRVYYSQAHELQSGARCGGHDSERQRRRVFTHGDNAREIELMVDYGMKPIDALKSATSIAARVLHMDDGAGLVKETLLADSLPSTETRPSIFGAL